MQVALGELTYQVEAAERLRAELRAASTRLAEAHARAAEAGAALAAADAARGELERQLAGERAQHAKQASVEARLSVRAPQALALMPPPAHAESSLAVPCNVWGQWWCVLPRM